jgi:hypothetical protein
MLLLRETRREYVRWEGPTVLIPTQMISLEMGRSRDARKGAAEEAYHKAFKKNHRKIW